MNGLTGLAGVVRLGRLAGMAGLPGERRFLKLFLFLCDLVNSVADFRQLFDRDIGGGDRARDYQERGKH
ncbi:MAG: hypothetical protein A2089_08890 [Elusimicrobia bacterium GWD2_63_28]|nr:MAG: hypothetical protein A2089_08890 [Elusimicrobia bacterium GWD2_63_28]